VDDAQQRREQLGVRRHGAQHGFAFQSQKSAALRLLPLPYIGHCSPAPAICPYNLTN
jgi:hypothetical protein